MEETTLITEEPVDEGFSVDDLSGGLDTFKQVFAFLQSIIDAIAGFLQPVFVDLIKGIM